MALYENMFNLIKYHGFSEVGLYSMVPWELEIFTGLAIASVTKKP